MSQTLPAWAEDFELATGEPLDPVYYEYMIHRLWQIAFDLNLVTEDRAGRWLIADFSRVWRFFLASLQECEV